MTLGVSHPRNIPTVLELAALAAPESIYDMGCGIGTYGPLLRSAFPQALIVGMDGWEGNRHPNWSAYDWTSIRDLGAGGWIKGDLFLLVDVLEHMERPRGFRLLKLLVGQKVICTPRNWPQGEDPDGNPYHAHKSTWSEADFDFAHDRSDAEFVIGLTKGVMA